MPSTPASTSSSASSSASSSDSGRRAELDAVRVLVVVGLVFFHSALVFGAHDDFYVKNAETTDVTLVVAAVGVLWAMPLLFFLAGLGAWHSLRRRSTGAFVVERLRRLGVPLLFGTLVLVPVPQWLRLRADPAHQESYLEFLPRFFRIDLEPGKFPFVLQGEFFETGHLWFLVLLLTFSLLLAPATHGFRSPANRDRVARLRDRMAAFAERRRGATLLPAVPLAVWCALAGLEEEYGGWHRWAYLLFYLFGFVFATDDRFRAAARRDARLIVLAGLLFCLVGVPAMLLAGDAAFTGPAPLAMAGRSLFGAAGWCWLMAIIGLLDRVRPARPRTGGREPRRWYAYLSEAVLPLYILHQPIVVAVAYGVVRWDAPIAVKFTVIVMASFALLALAYDLLVRRTGVTRFLFGLRPAPRAARDQVDQG
ncbi:acyltransferase [Nonomuraea sp. MTCD27]|uniref:acyltransferase family protein n=1 Tax=Nonomuraea sp. MTCD27 TaxID=1676747 RepID=UPI0035C14C73